MLTVSSNSHCLKPNLVTVGFSPDLEKSEDDNVQMQLQLFDEHERTDEEQNPGTKGIDLGNPLDVFHAILRQFSIEYLGVYAAPWDRSCDQAINFASQTMTQRFLNELLFTADVNVF
ncbi:hypothetical protein RRG08_040071 [Elysia crispata]|uniref:Uncharacterized protein n=1 Tax=Elysia crispata TaxID=231223 RepID=A0AAE0XWE9_9GAST|nr:hypothetical protein RRG08_040071 [Elysia crispata]